MSDKKVTVDDGRFVIVDGVKICKVTEDGKLQFKDKDRRRSSRRGCCTVEVSPAELADVITNTTTKNE